MDELQAVGDPELREALLFARAQSRPITADELAAARRVHRNVARSRLERLVEADLLAAGYERRTGRSGPELEPIEFPARRYETLLGLLLDAVPPHGRSERSRQVGVAFGAELARTAGLQPAKTLRTGFERMCEAVRSLGYQVSVAEVGEEGAVIETPTCPLRPLVRARPEAAEIDRGMWAGLAARALDGVEVERVECETRDCLVDHDACRVLVTLAARRRPDVRRARRSKYMSEV